MKTPDAINKGLKTSKSKTRLVAIVAIATIITVFCLVSAKTLFSQATYNKRVLDARHEALTQLEANVGAADQLMGQYQIFQTGNNTNIIGGKNSTDPSLAPPNGDNARIVLDALPSKYDFPALISSVAKILDNNGFTNQSVEGKDLSNTINSDPTPKPELATITLVVTGTGNYKAVGTLVKDFERSIRPFDITKVEVKGSESNMSVSLTMDTYFQPALSLTLSTKEIK